MFIYITHNSQKVIVSDVIDSINRRMDQLCHITREYYAVIGRNEALISARTWMILKTIKLSDRSHAQNARYCLMIYM